MALQRVCAPAEQDLFVGKLASVVGTTIVNMPWSNSVLGSETTCIRIVVHAWLLPWSSLLRLEERLSVVHKVYTKFKKSCSSKVPVFYCLIKNPKFFVVIFNKSRWVWSRLVKISEKKNLVKILWIEFFH